MAAFSTTVVRPVSCGRCRAADVVRLMSSG
jgi:hypothetical protein